MPGREGAGWRSHCSHLPTDTYAHPSYRVLYAVVLQSRCPGALRFAVPALVVFGENALKYAAKVLAIIEWGTQHWKLQEPFPVPQVPRWLRMPEIIQTTMPLRGELPLIPLGTHLEDICVCSPALWAWIVILLQYWQDYMTQHLFGGCF